MPVVHFLNVKDGDCSIIQHVSGHVTVIDVCNAKPSEPLVEALIDEVSKSERGITGNFQQKEYPVNPVSYLYQHGITKIFRYVQTHPDMDHMDGIEVLFREFRPDNFWDTNNTKEMENWEGSPYKMEDWEFYRQLRNTNPPERPKRLTLLSGARGQYYNIGQSGSEGGDGLHILAPTANLVDEANRTSGDFHSCSYVLLYKTGANRIVFSGDSHDKTWEHILTYHRADVTGIDLLIAPHHGRDSDRSYEFLDILRPTLTFFGNARSEHLAYDAWRSRRLAVITNNQANCMVVDASITPMLLYVTHENFARRLNPATFWAEACRPWYVGPITAV